MDPRIGAKRATALLAAAVLACGVGILSASAAPRYGTMIVELGSITLIRDGKATQYKQSLTAVDVNEQDLIRVREASKATLTTADKGKVIFGANAIFSCKPWQAANRTGFLSLIYGRMRAVAQGLRGDESFNVKTVQAIIGVKGTEYGLIQTSNGQTTVLGIESTTTLTGGDNHDQPVGPDQFSSVVPGQGATPAFEAPAGLKTALVNLNAPPPNDPQGARTPGVQIFERRGDRDVFAPTNLDDAQQTGNAHRTGVILKFNP